MGKMIFAVAVPVWFITWITLAAMGYTTAFAIVCLSPMAALAFALLFTACYDSFMEGYKEFKNK